MIWNPFSRYKRMVQVGDVDFSLTDVRHIDGLAVQVGVAYSVLLRHRDAIRDPFGADWTSLRMASSEHDFYVDLRTGTRRVDDVLGIQFSDKGVLQMFGYSPWEERLLYRIAKRELVATMQSLDIEHIGLEHFRDLRREGARFLSVPINRLLDDLSEEETVVSGTLRLV